MTPGFKTTEFWLTLLANLMSALVLCGVVADGTPWAKVVAVVTMLLSSLGYTAMRTSAKNNAPPAVVTTTFTAEPGATTSTTKTEPAK